MKNEAAIDHSQHYRQIAGDNEDHILEELLEAFNSSPDLMFLNFYKEVAIVSPVDFLCAIDGSLFCKTSEVQSRAIANSNNTIIRSESLRHDVFACAQYRSGTGEIIISEPKYVEVCTDRRSSVRVKMDYAFPILIEAGHNRFNADLLELSLNGCAVAIPDQQLLGSYKYFYLSLEMPFQTSARSNNARIMTKLIRGEQNATSYRCIFLFEHDNTTEDQIGRLLALRQTGIIRELK